MSLIDVDTAVAEIVEGARKAGANHPWFLMVGAGVSAPHVPLAYQIIEHCKQKAERDSSPARSAAPTPGDEYSHWLEVAYADAADRQRYFQSLIEKARISHSNFRLAHLLESGCLGRLMLTTNFDDLVSRALRLLRQQHITCDHPATVSPRIDPRRADIQIVHIHGSYWFYDACNLKSEMARRAEEMSVFMTDLLRRRSPIVLGYSGQEPGDAFMRTLKELLPSRSFSAPIYWFCYGRHEPGRIRKILGDTDLIRFVAPSDVGARLEATVVLDKLLRAFKVEPPAFLSDPLEFLANSVEQDLPPLELGATDAYLDLLVFLEDRLREAAQRERAARGQVGETVSKIRRALLSEQWDEASALSLSIDSSYIEGSLRKEVLLALVRTGLKDASSNRIQILERAIATTSAPASKGELRVPDIELAALAASKRAELLQEADDLDGAREAWDAIVEALGDAPTEFLRELFFRARIERCLIDRDSRRQDLHQIAAELEPEVNPILRAERARVRLMLAASAEPQDASMLAIYDEVIRDLEPVQTSKAHNYLAIARVLRAYRLRELGHVAEAVASAARVIRDHTEGFSVGEQLPTASDLVVNAISTRLIGMSELPPRDRLVRATEILDMSSGIELQEVTALAACASYHAAFALEGLGELAECSAHIERALHALPTLPADVADAIRSDLTELLARLAPSTVP